jgi:hypothetical protein
MKRILRVAPLTILMLACHSAACADDILLQVRDIPQHGLVVAPVDLTEAVQWCKAGEVVAKRVQAVDENDRQVPCQFVPDPGFDSAQHVGGTVVLKLPSDSSGRLRLVLQGTEQGTSEPFNGTVRTKNYEVVHNAAKLGGLPSKITFTESGKVFDSLRWHDRTHHKEQGGYRLIDEREAKVERIATGPLCTVVRVTGRYMRGAEQPASRPSAVYQWYYFHDMPLVYVTALQTQQEEFAWKEWHFLELIYPDDSFTRWAGAGPEAQGDVAGSGKSTNFSEWAALLDGRNAIGMMRSGRLLVHDGRGAYGTYLHAFGTLAWQDFAGTERELGAWLWVGSDDDPAKAIREAAENLPTDAHVAVTVNGVRNRLADTEARLESLSVDAARTAWWQLAAAEQLEAQGRYKEAIAAVDGKLPEQWVSLTAGDLAISFEHTNSGLRMLQLGDLAQRRQLLAARPLPLFQATLRNAETKEEVAFVADSGWKHVEAGTDPTGLATLLWKDPADQRFGGLTIRATASPDADSDRITWDLTIENVPRPWGAWRTVFPQVALAKPGPNAEVFYPRGAGEVKSGVWSEAFRFTGTYPSGWMSMPFMAVYDRAAGTGLYTAIHDPFGSTKDLVAASRPVDRALDLTYDHPAVNMGQPGVGFGLEGTAVWQLLRGDWFDASVIYRDWVREEARWYPGLGSKGREDTPKWMRELSCWALASGTSKQVVPATKDFQKAIGLPVGVHWYNWHEIPFDNDYPHYFPTKPGFAEGVAELQAANVFVMPYINGRLWDTRDRDMEVFQFDDVALPAATKKETGEPYTEMYGSKEGDGSRVSLAAMCPTTDLWKAKVREIVLRLMNECGVRGVYIDQVAAAKPQLCFDTSHGHPLGGGHWWTEGYWDLLEKIYADMPEGHMLTTECNAEPYTHRFDGYLTWHWQYDGQVPAFPAVYGGAIQMFGRAYRGGPSKDLALRMKAGQQLVYGEQIGWINPAVTKEPDNMAFLRQVVHLRARLIDYFVRGEMARPPRLGDCPDFRSAKMGLSPSGASETAPSPIPEVTADWQWRGVWPVTTDAVLTGSWRLPSEDRAILLFVNVSEEPVTARFDFDAATYGLPRSKLTIHKISADGAEPESGIPVTFGKEVTFPPKAAWAWEFAAD